MDELEAAEEAISATLAKKNPGPRHGRIEVPLEGVFAGSISTAHQNDPFSDPAIAIVFSIFAHQRDGSSVVLYEQVIPWDGAVPGDDELKKWIDFCKDRRVVTFGHPTGAFSHPLPRKR